MLLSEAWTVQAEHCLQLSQEGPALAPKTPTRDFEHAVKGPHSLSAGEPASLDVG